MNLYQRTKCTKYINKTANNVQIKLDKRQVVDVESGQSYKCENDTYIVKVKFPNYTGWRNI